MGRQMSIVGEIGIFAFGGRSETDLLVVNLRNQGWIACEGQSVDQRGAAGLPALFSVLSTTWGTADPTNVFYIPDLRGKFLRGWNHASGIDPDSAARVAAKPGGMAGDAVGSSQPDQLASHTHGLKAGVPIDQNNNSQDFAVCSSSPRLQALPASGGGEETRPKNAYVMFCIFTGAAPLPKAIKFFA